MVLFSNNDIILLEPSVVTNSEVHTKAASSRKEARYWPLVSDLELADFSVSLVTIEVGCSGHFLPSSVSNLCKVCHLQKNYVHFFRQASKVTISYSYQIFNACSSKLWDVTNLLSGCITCMYGVMYLYVLLYSWFCLARDPASWVPLSLGLLLFLI